MGPVTYFLVFALGNQAASNTVPAQVGHQEENKVGEFSIKIEYEEGPKASAEDDHISTGCNDCSWGIPLNANDQQNAKILKDKKAFTNPADLSAAAWAMENGLIDNNPEMKVHFKPRILNAKLSKRWPSGEVPYTIENTFTDDHRAVIQAGMNDITAKTCVSFRSKEDTDLDWMEIVSTGGSGCYANAAYYGPGHGSHTVNLQLNGCVHIGVVVHELLHILSVSHEQQRPDRDSFVDMHWMNIQVNKSSNMWRFASLSEDFNSLEKCTDKDQDGKDLTDPQDFSNCVGGSAQVDDFGIPYDYKSVMHYHLYLFAIVKNTKVMTPKNGYDGQIGSATMSDDDITRLQRAYSCKETAPYTYSGCGGFRYSSTGGDMDGTQEMGCEWILKTDFNKGITINISTFDIPGDCSTEYLEVRGGTASDGSLIGKFCVDNPPPSSLTTNHNAIYAKYVKKESGSSASWSATWTVSEMTCCSKVAYEKSSKGGSYSLVDGKSFKGHPVYKQDGGNKFMVNCPKYNKWVIVDSDYASSKSSCPPNYEKNSDGGAYCPHDAIGTWSFYNGEGFTEIMDSKVSCIRYSETGGNIDGTESVWILKTDLEKGITIDFSSFNIPGDCSTEYLEVRAGISADGSVIGKYCSDNPPPGILTTKHNSLYINYVKQPSGSSSSWTAASVTCCPKVVYEDSSLGGGYSLVEGENFKGYPVYKKDDQDRFMVACPGTNKWVIVPSDYSSSHNSCPGYYQKIKASGAYCPQDLITDGDSKVRCSNCDLYPAEIECVTCCSKVTLTGNHSDWLNTGFYTAYFDGGWTATGQTINELAEYQSDQKDTYCLWSNTNSNWMINNCGSGGASGFAFGSGPSGMKCPEQANAWRFYSQTQKVILDDPGMKVNCAVSCSTDPPTTPEGASSDWDSTTKFSPDKLT